jgi:endo-1,4-beta-xylanase
VRRPALLIGTGAVVLLLAVLLVVVLARGGQDPGTSRPGPSTTPAPAPSVAPSSLTTVLASGFDEGTEGWEPLGEGVATAVVGSPTRSGAGSLLVTGRSEAWHGAAVDVSALLARGQVHTVSAWVRLGGDATGAEVRLTLERDPGSDEPRYLAVGQAAAQADGWVEVAGTVEVPEGEGPWRLYVETTGSTADLRLDDVTVQRPAPPVQTDVPALRDVSAIPVGFAVGPQELTGRPAELLLRHADRITPENAMKPAWIQPEEGVFDFGPLDEVLDVAVAHGLEVHGHTLVWHRSTPDWFFTGADGRALTSDPADRQLLLDRLRAHVQAVADHLAERYGDADPVTSWDIVNEPLDPAQPDGLRHSRWYEVLGPDYVAEAFRVARDVLGPDATLYLNDYDTDAPDRRRALVRLLVDLQDQGAPVDAVGHQTHASLRTDPDRVAATWDAVAALGLRQAVTELDVAVVGRGEDLASVPADRLEEQADQVQALVATVAARDPEFIGVWGLDDPRSWLRGSDEGSPVEEPLLFDGDLQAKPAFWGFVRGLGTSG